MTGICYYKDEDNYLLDKQVESIINEEDECLLIEQSDRFSFKSADELIQEALYKNCDKLIFLTESSMSGLLSQLIPQEYGDKFNEIQVIEENFIRFHENNLAAAPKAPVQPVQPAAQPVSKIVPQTRNPAQPTKNGNKPDDGQPPKHRLIFICNAAAPSINNIDIFFKATQTWTTTNQKIVGNLQPEYWFCDVPNAHLQSSSIKQLYLNYPSMGGELRKRIETFNRESYDGLLESIVEILDKDKDQYTLVVPPGYKINKQLANTKIYNLTGQNGQFENANNSDIVNYLSEMSKDVKNNYAKLKKRFDKWDEKATKEFQGEVKKMAQYIEMYLTAFTFYETKKDLVRKSKSNEDELLKAFGDIMKQGLEIDHIEKDWKDAGFGLAIDAAHKLSKAVKDELKDKEKNETKLNNDATSQKLRNIYMYENFQKLCFLLFGKNVK